jgi:hypothetical protein
MTFYNTFVRRQNLGRLATGLGILGLAFFWWVPMGLMLALAGLVLGFIDWMRLSQEASPHGWVFTGLALSALALIVDSVIAANGLAMVWMMSYQ